VISPDATAAHRPFRLRQMLSLLVAFVALLAAGAIALFLAQSYRAELDDARTRTQDAARLLQEHIVRTLRASDFIVGRAAQIGRTHAMDRLPQDERAWRELVALVQGLPEPGTLWVVDAKGIVRLGTMQFPTPQVNVTDRRYFAAHQQAQRDIVIGPLVTTKAGDKQAFHLSRRIEDAEGNFLGVAAAGFDADTFTDFYRTLPLGDHAALGVIDLDGRVILHQPDPERWAGASVPSSPLLETMRNGVPIGTLTAVSPLDGVERLIAYRLVPEFGLVVMVGMSTDEALTDWRRTLWATGLMAVVLAVLVGTLAAFTFASLAREEALIQGLERTVHERTEEAHAQAEEARRANEGKTRFLATASHDLRQPLQAAAMFAEVLAVRLEDHACAPVVSKLRQSLDATHQLLTTLLDVSSLEAGKIETQIGSFPLMPLIANLYDQMEPEASAKGLELRVVPTSAWVVSDPVLLERMARNLLVNAIRYTQSGKVLIGCRHRGDKVALCVADTGIGIAEDKLDVIFEDFTRLGDKGAGTNRGLGLGLGVVRRTAILLGHDIEVHSTVGKGSCFALLLSLA
jgi:signal transduction histidine kinase